MNQCSDETHNEIKYTYSRFIDAQTQIMQTLAYKWHKKFLAQQVAHLPGGGHPKMEMKPLKKGSAEFCNDRDVSCIQNRR